MLSPLHEDVDSFYPASLLFIAESSQCVYLRNRYFHLHDKESPESLQQSQSQTYQYVCMVTICYDGLVCHLVGESTDMLAANIFFTFVLLDHGHFRNCLKVHINPDRVPQLQDHPYLLPVNINPLLYSVLFNHHP